MQALTFADLRIPQWAIQHEHQQPPKARAGARRKNDGRAKIEAAKPDRNTAKAAESGKLDLNVRGRTIRRAAPAPYVSATRGAVCKEVESAAGRIHGAHAAPPNPPTILESILATHDGFYEEIREAILEASGLSEARLDEAAVELEAEYANHLIECDGQSLDEHAGFVDMLRQQPNLGRRGALKGFSVAQLLLAFAWFQNDRARLSLSRAVEVPARESLRAVGRGVIASVCATNLVGAATALMQSLVNHTTRDEA